MGRLMGFAGLATMLGLAFLFSTNRRKISLKTLIWGISLQFLFALFVLRFSFGRNLLTWAGAGVNQLLGYSFAGSSFVFGELGKKNGQMGFAFAFQALARKAEQESLQEGQRSSSRGAAPGTAAGRSPGGRRRRRASPCRSR